MKQKVISREYKVMLKKECFVGSQDDLLQKAGEFWAAFEDSIQDIALGIEGTLDEVDKRRTVSFFDTTDHRLRKNDYVFRERVDLSNGEREVTLKFRHPDRYISQDRNMDAADKEEGKTKFEEDIKPPFLKLFSFSTKQPIPEDKNLNRLNDPGRLYPDLPERLKSYQENEPITKVAEFTARELVIKGAEFKLNNSPEGMAECALIAWYEKDGDSEKPVVVEFSFNYENEEEDYDGESAQVAFNAFSQLQVKDSDLEKKWVDLKGPTKTKYVYCRAQPNPSTCSERIR